MRALPLLLGLGALVLAFPVRAQDRAVTPHPVRNRAQQAEQELKTERDRPHKKERAKAAVGRVEDGVREFGRGLQGVMKEAGIGDGAPAQKAPAKSEKPRSKGKPEKPASAPKPPAAAAK